MQSTNGKNTCKLWRCVIWQRFTSHLLLPMMVTLGVTITAIPAIYIQHYKTVNGIFQLTSPMLSPLILIVLWLLFIPATKVENSQSDVIIVEISTGAAIRQATSFWLGWLYGSIQGIVILYTCSPISPYITIAIISVISVMNSFIRFEKMIGRHGGFLTSNLILGTYIINSTTDENGNYSILWRSIYENLILSSYTTIVAFMCPCLFVSLVLPTIPVVESDSSHGIVHKSQNCHLREKNLPLLFSIVF